MPARIIDGKTLAVEVRKEVAEGVADLVAGGVPVPELDVVLIGDDPASHVYVANKVRQTEAVGMRSRRFVLDANTTERRLLDLIEELNRDAAVNGILGQFPLPPYLDTAPAVVSIRPAPLRHGFVPLN